MRQMFLDYAQTYEGFEIDILVLDTENNLVCRDKREYINFATGLAEVVNIIHNVGVDKVYSDTMGTGIGFTDSLDRELTEQKSKCIVVGIQHVQYQALYRPKGGKSVGHQKEDLFRF